MARFQGKRVSRTWGRILRAANRHGVKFTLNDGQRTMADQRQRVRDHGLWSPSNPTGAAQPSPTAPHVREGHENHALDVSTLDGGETRLQNWLNSQGLNAINTVSTEAWHLEVLDEAALIRLGRYFMRRQRIRRRLEKLVARRKRVGRTKWLTTHIRALRRRFKRVRR